MVKQDIRNKIITNNNSNFLLYKKMTASHLILYREPAPAKSPAAVGISVGANVGAMSDDTVSVFAEMAFTSAVAPIATALSLIFVVKLPEATFAISELVVEVYAASTDVKPSEAMEKETA